MSVRINNYLIDAALSESHSYPSDVTSFPVEKGETSDLTDHIRNEPIEVEIEGIVSNTPIGATALARENETAEAGEELEFLPSEEALARLERIRARRLPVTIQTSLKVYENMALIGLDVPRDPTTGRALRFTARFRQITTVTNLRTTIRTATPAGRAKTKLGAKVGPTKTIDQFHRDFGSRTLVFTVVNGKKPDFAIGLVVGGALVSEQLELVDGDKSYYRANKSGYVADGYVKGGVYYPLKSKVTIPGGGGAVHTLGVVHGDTTSKVWHEYTFQDQRDLSAPQNLGAGTPIDDPEVRWVNVFSD